MFVSCYSVWMAVHFIVWEVYAISTLCIAHMKGDPAFLSSWSKVWEFFHFLTTFIFLGFLFSCIADVMYPYARMDLSQLTPHYNIQSCLRRLKTNVFVFTN